MMETAKKQLKLAEKKKIAFVCSGGGTKAGAFHLGVALALREHGFSFLGGRHGVAVAPVAGAELKPTVAEISMYVGSSAGALIATFLAAGYSLEAIFQSFIGQREAKSSFQLGEGGGQQFLPRLTYSKMFRLAPLEKMNNFKQLKKIREFFFDLVEGVGQRDPLLEFAWLKTSGLFCTAGIEEYVRQEVLSSNQFEDYAAELCVVATDLDRAQQVVFGKAPGQTAADATPLRDADATAADRWHAAQNYEQAVGVGIADAVASSVALPLLFQPHCVMRADGQKRAYIDGEIRDTLSTHVAVDRGADLVIASYTHQPLHVLPGEKSLSEQGLSSIGVQAIYVMIEQKIIKDRLRQQSHQNTLQAILHFCQEIQLSQEQTEKIATILKTELGYRPEVDYLYIHPDPYDTQLFLKEHFSLSPSKIPEIVQSGFRAGKQALAELAWGSGSPAATGTP